MDVVEAAVGEAADDVTGFGEGFEAGDDGFGVGFVVGLAVGVAEVGDDVFGIEVFRAGNLFGMVDGGDKGAGGGGEGIREFGLVDVSAAGVGTRLEETPDAGRLLGSPTK